MDAAIDVWIFVMLVLSCAGTVSSLQRARRAEDAAKHARSERDFAQRLEAVADLGRARERAEYERVVRENRRLENELRKARARRSRA
jgi:hypothetical protein